MKLNLGWLRETLYRIYFPGFIIYLRFHYKTISRLMNSAEISLNWDFGF